MYFALKGKGLKAAAKFVFNSYKVFQFIIAYWKIEKILTNILKKIFKKVGGSGLANILGCVSYSIIFIINITDFKDFNTAAILNKINKNVIA